MVFYGGTSLIGWEVGYACTMTVDRAAFTPSSVGVQERAMRPG